MLLATAFELKDVFSPGSDFIYEFLGCPERMTRDKVCEYLRHAGFPSENLDEPLKLLVWFGFLGVEDQKTGEPRYAYQFGHDINKLLVPLGKNAGTFVIHPVFRKALECGSATH